MVWLPLLREVSGNMYIAMAGEPGFDVMNFEWLQLDSKPQPLSS